MRMFMILFVTVLFVLLTPGLLFSVPKGGNKWTVALVHALLFALIYHFTHKLVWTLFYKSHHGKKEAFMSKYEDEDEM